MISDHTDTSNPCATSYGSVVAGSSRNVISCQNRSVVSYQSKLNNQVDSLMIQTDILENEFSNVPQENSTVEHDVGISSQMNNCHNLDIASFSQFSDDLSNVPVIEDIFKAENVYAEECHQQMKNENNYHDGENRPHCLSTQKYIIICIIIGNST